jgi:uncharacterized protein (TIGR03066 family)
MRAVLVGMASAVLMAAVGGSAVGQEEKVDGKLLIGKWEPKMKEGKDFTVEFTKDGKMIFSIGAELKVEGTYKLTGNKLSYTMKFGGEEKTESRTINSLSKTELTSTDEKGKKDTIVRVGDKK